MLEFLQLLEMLTELGFSLFNMLRSHDSLLCAEAETHFSCPTALQDAHTGRPAFSRNTFVGYTSRNGDFSGYSSIQIVAIKTKPVGHFKIKPKYILIFKNFHELEGNIFLCCL